MFIKVVKDLFYLVNIFIVISYTLSMVNLFVNETGEILFWKEKLSLTFFVNKNTIEKSVAFLRLAGKESR